jgi:DNA-binding Lrp family transcriptional regulator
MTPAPPNNTIRVAARLANSFALDLVKLGGFGRDVIDGLLLAAISQANVVPITRDPVLQRAYASLDQAPPDEIRRPVSINAIANSLRVPFETARRRITSLINSGVLQSTAKGVILPHAPLNSPFYRLAAERNYTLVKTLYFRLSAIGMLKDMARPNGPPFDPDHPPVRLVIRMSSDYLLRLVEPINEHIGDVVTGLVLMEVFHANTSHLPDTNGGSVGPHWSADSFVSDDDRRPVSAADVARSLGMPAETVRRRLAKLVATNRCERDETGYWVSSQVLAQGALVEFALANQGYLNRFFASLAEYGVLLEWERELDSGRAN